MRQTTSATEQYGLNADRVLHISSAGLGSGISSPTDLPDSQEDVDRYSMTAPGVGQVADMAVTDAGQTYADSISDGDSAPVAMFKAGGSLASYGPAAANAAVDAAKDFYDWATPW